MLLDPTTQALFAPVLHALQTHRAELWGLSGLVNARPGFDPSSEELKPVLVLAFKPPHPGSGEDLSARYGVTVVEVEADPEEQLWAEFEPGAPSELEHVLMQPM